MGFNSTVLVLNDALHEIANDPEFGKKVADAITQIHSRERIDVSAGNHGNAATVIETHHADGYRLILVGGNTAYVLGYAGHWSKDPKNVDDLKTLLNNVAEEYGLQVIRKRKKKE